jgi:sulfur relay (sulfurtransferase) DsrF/TusC family protein
MEASEINEFTEHIQESREKNMQRVSVAISILAVLVAMVTVLGHREHTTALLVQSRTAQQWSQYQARKIRQTEYATATDLLTLQPNSNAGAVKQKLSEYKTANDKLATQLSVEQNDARTLNEEVDKDERKADRYDMGEALLQIAIVLSSITLLTRHKRYLVFGVALGVVGTAITASVLLIR